MLGGVGEGSCEATHYPDLVAELRNRVQMYRPMTLDVVSRRRMHDGPPPPRSGKLTLLGRSMRCYVASQAMAAEPRLKS